MLASYLASLRRRPDLSRYLETHVDRWLAVARQIVETREVAPSIVGAAPVTLHASGDLDQAIAYYRRLHSQHQRYKIGPEDLAVLRFNWANSLIERQYYEYTADSRERNAQIEEIDALIAGSDNSPLILASPGAIEDTNGFKMIAFAQETKEVQKGISLCESVRPTKREASPIAWDYVDLHVRLGWRRLFEIEQHRR